MTDIVDRLRELGPYLLDDAQRAVIWEAADEIERLHEALEWATKQIGILSQYIETPEAMAKFDACRAVLARKP